MLLFMYKLKPSHNIQSNWWVDMLLNQNDVHIVKFLVESFCASLWIKQKNKKKFMDKAAGEVLAKREQNQYSPVWTEWASLIKYLLQ